MIDATQQLAAAGGINLLPALAFAIKLSPDMATAAVEPARNLTARHACRTSERDEAVGEIPTVAVFLLNHLACAPAGTRLAGILQILSGR